MALTLSFDGPDADRATAIHQALTSTSPDGVSQEMVDQLLEVAAGCSDRALADSASNAYLLAPVVADAGLSVRLVVPEGEDSWLTIELPEELRAEVERVRRSSSPDCGSRRSPRCADSGPTPPPRWSNW